MNPQHPGKSPDIFELRGERPSSVEHDVWLDCKSGVAYKIPRLCVCRDKYASSAQIDLYAMRESGVRVVPTEIYDKPFVYNTEDIRRRVSYLLVQPYLRESHPLAYSDLFHNEGYQRQLLNFFEQGQEIRARRNLGFDMLGGHKCEILMSIFNPCATAINPEISNLLVPETDISAQADFHQSGIKKGDLVARKGEIAQCDTRMYNFNRRLRRPFTETQEMHDTAISVLLDSFGHRTKFDFEKNCLRRMVRELVRLALPKMRAYAEAIR